MATLNELRQDFTQLAAALVQQAKKMGYGVTFGEVYRSDEQAVINSLGAAGRATVAAAIRGLFPTLANALSNNGAAGGIARSVHQLGLAVDINLFKDGVYLTSSEDHRPLGDWWKAQHPLARWGGDFKPKPDGNHYSFEYGGVK